MSVPDLHLLTIAAGEAARTASPPGTAFRDAWLQLHYASQLASEVGKAWGEPQADDSHSSLGWRDGALVGPLIEAPRPFRAALRPRELTLTLVGTDGALVAARPLAGVRFADAMQWVRTQAARAAGGEARHVSVPAPDLPPHPVADGAAFRIDASGAFAALADLLAGADRVLGAVAAALPDASPVRVWPHHFDMATLATITTQRTLGVGLATPDAIEPGGYWYVSPWSASPPSGPAREWCALSHGRWIPRGALQMAVLPLGAWSALTGPDARAEVLGRFLHDACGCAAANLLR
jgi:hypothetical protein